MSEKIGSLGGKKIVIPAESGGQDGGIVVLAAEIRNPDDRHEEWSDATAPEVAPLARVLR
ncbi:MAG: hypothetical protein GY722_14005 [bacterium]|nr:hypothetical protein [bacterium]